MDRVEPGRPVSAPSAQITETVEVSYNVAFSEPVCSSMNWPATALRASVAFQAAVRGTHGTDW